MLLNFVGTFQPPNWLRYDITESRPRGWASDVQVSSHRLQGESLDPLSRGLLCNRDSLTRNKWQEHFPYLPFSTCSSSDQNNPLWHLWDGASVHVNLIPIVRSSSEAATSLHWIGPRGPAHRIPQASSPLWAYPTPVSWAQRPRPLYLGRTVTLAPFSNRTIKVWAPLLHKVPQLTWTSACDLWSPLWGRETRPHPYYLSWKQLMLGKKGREGPAGAEGESQVQLLSYLSSFAVKSNEFPMIWSTRNPISILGAPWNQTGGEWASAPFSPTLNCFTSKQLLIDKIVGPLLTGPLPIT